MNHLKNSNDLVSLTSSRLDAFKVCANDVINFKLVRTESDFEDDKSAPVFKPSMTHQIFGESENIFGYKDLSIDIFCTACKMITYIGVKFSEKINPKKFDGVQADNILKMLNDKFQPGYHTSLDAFSNALQNDEDFIPFGVLVHSYTVDKKDGSAPRNFDIYFVSEASEKFKSYHERLQPFLLFFIDAASYIDADDLKWSYFIIHERYRSKVTGNTAHAFVGYMTVYKYYAYPDMIRPRISQVLVMPPFQGQGHCTTLLQTFYKWCMQNRDVLDVAVEDPSEDFQRIRDFLDCRNCSALKSFHPDNLRKGFSQDMADESRDVLKLSKRQVRRVYEILRLRHTNCFDDQQFKSYRVDVKRRLNAPFQKSKRHFERMCRLLKPNELAATLNNISPELRLEHIEKQFQSLVNEYRHIIDKLEMCT